MAGVLIASTGSGALVSRYGRYKAYPLVGAVLVVIALYLLSQLTAEAAVWHVCLALGVMGVGLAARADAEKAAHGGDGAGLAPGGGVTAHRRLLQAR